MTSRSAILLSGLLLAASTAVAQTPGDQPPQLPRSPALRPAGGGVIGAPGAAQRPPPRATMFNPSTNVKALIDAAVARCAPDRRRVLVIWGDNASRWAVKVEEQLQVPSTMSMIRNDYEVVAADTADPSFGPLNLALAQAYGAKPARGANAMPSLTVIEASGERAGKAVTNKGADVWIKETSSKTNGDFFTILVQDFLVENRAPKLHAPEVRAAALAKAAERGVNAFVYFNDLEDPWCTRFVQWLKLPAVSVILEKHFVVTTIDLMRMDDGPAEYAALGGEQSEAAPWYILLDPGGKRLAPDKARGEKDLGFPTGDEVGEFVKMLRRVDATITGAEAAALEQSLRPQPAAAPAEPAQPLSPSDKRN